MPSRLLCPAGLLCHGAPPRNPTRHAIQVNDTIVEQCQTFGSDMRTLEIGMQTFYFDCEHAACRDECLGHALVNYREAHRMGIRFVGELLQHEPEGLIDGHDLIVTVSDDNHLALFTIHASSMSSAAINGSR